MLLLGLGLAQRSAAAAYCEDFSADLGSLSNSQAFGPANALTAQLAGSGTVTQPGDGYLYLSDTATAAGTMVRSTSILPAQYSLSFRYRIDWMYHGSSAANLDVAAIYDDNAWVPAPSGAVNNDNHLKIVNYPDGWTAQYRHMVMYQAPGWIRWNQPTLAWVPGFSNTTVSFTPGAWYVVNMSKTATNYAVTIWDDTGVLQVGPTNIPISTVRGAAFGDYFGLGDARTDYNWGRIVVDWLCLDMLPTTPTLSPTASTSPTQTLSATLTPAQSPTPSSTATGTATSTPASSATRTATVTPTLTATGSFTRTASPSASLTPALSGTPTPSLSATPSPSMTPSPGLSVSATPGAFHQQASLLELLGVYPNPFSEAVHFGLSLRVAAWVHADFYGVGGEPVLKDHGRFFPAGKGILAWDGVNGSGQQCSSGVYLCRLSARGVDGTQEVHWSKVAIAR